MFYPGQPVFIPEEKRLGIYLGHTVSNIHPYDKILYVFTLFGNDGQKSSVQMFDVKDTEPVVKPDKTSKTGQSSIKFTFSKMSISKSYTETELEHFKTTFIEELQKIARAKWFKARYEINTEE